MWEFPTEWLGIIVAWSIVGLRRCLLPRQRVRLPARIGALVRGDRPSAFQCEYREASEDRTQAQQMVGLWV